MPAVQADNVASAFAKATARQGATSSTLAGAGKNSDKQSITVINRQKFMKRGTSVRVRAGLATTGECGVRSGGGTDWQALQTPMVCDDIR
jgi:hypothetical protein